MLITEPESISSDIIWPVVPISRARFRLEQVFGSLGSQSAIYSASGHDHLQSTPGFYTHKTHNARKDDSNSNSNFQSTPREDQTIHSANAGRNA